jgi:MFS family permease
LPPSPPPSSDYTNSNGKSSNGPKPPGLRNVLAMGLVSFFTDFSTEMILGILPLYIVNNLGASRAILGTIEGSAELISYTFRMVSGSLSDKLGKRKIFVIIGYGLSTASKPFFAASTGWIEAFIVRATDRIGKGVRTAPRDALIADSVSETISGKAFGIHRTIDQLGAIVGPIAAFAILQVMDIRFVFLFSLIPGAIAVFILIYFVREVTVKRYSSTKVTVFSNIGSLVTKRENRPFVFLLVVSGIFGLGAFNFSFILLKASDLKVEESFIPIIYAVINVAHTVIGIPAGILADRIGEEKVLIIGYIVFAVSTILMAILSESPLSAYILALIFGTYLGIGETVQRAIIPKYVPSEMRGTAYGLYYLVAGVTFFAANVVFGFLWDAFTLNIAVLYSIVLSVGAIIGMFVFVKEYSNRSNTSKVNSKEL